MKIKFISQELEEQQKKGLETIRIRIQAAYDLARDYHINAKAESGTFGSYHAYGRYLALMDEVEAMMDVLHYLGYQTVPERFNKFDDESIIEQEIKIKAP